MGRPRSGMSEFCTRCGVEVYRPPSKRNGRPFCSRQCHMATLNEELNPTRMTPDVRAKLRAARLSKGPLTFETRQKIRNVKLLPEAGKSYAKLFGRHEHRVVAEWILGRQLRRGEVVHHIDRNKRNNRTDNLMVFSSQAEHAAWHKTHDKGGDAE